MKPVDRWRCSALSDVCEVGPRDPALPSSAPFVPMDSVQVGSRWPKYYEERGDRGGVRAQDNDILFARITPCLENGKLAQVPAGTGVVGGSTEFIVIRPGPDIDPGFLYYWCLEPSVRADARSMMAGVTGRMRLGGKQLASFPMPVPALRDQRQIVDILENHLSRLDAAGAGLESASRRATLLTVASGMQAITGAGSTETSGSISFGDRETPLPRGWQASTVGDQATLVQYGTSSKTSEAADSDAIAVLRMGNLQRGTIMTDKLKYLPRAHPDVASLLLRRGDLLFNRTNSAELVGKSAVFDRDDHAMTFASYLIRVRFGPAVRPAWANLVINSPLGRAYIGSVASQQVGQANVNGTKLKAFPLIVPPQDDQDRLLARYEAINETSRRLSAETVQGLQQASLLRRSLLQAAFSGKLTGHSSPYDRAGEALA